MTYFCNETCRSLASRSHAFRCIPSVTPQESRSIGVAPTCPEHMLDEARRQIHMFAKDNNSSSTTITSGRSFDFDERNFSTIRIKLKDDVNSLVLFSPAASKRTRYAILQDTTGDDDGSSTATTVDNRKTPTERNPSDTVTATDGSPDSIIPEEFANRTDEELAADDDNCAAASEMEDEDKDRGHQHGHVAETSVKWQLPTTEPFFHLISPPAYSDTSASSSSSFSLLSPSPPMRRTGGGTYLVITPGKDMLASLVSKRLRARSNAEDEKGRLSALQLPDADLIEYAQGLRPPKRKDPRPERRPLVHVVEWSSK